LSTGEGVARFGGGEAEDAFSVELELLGLLEGLEDVGHGEWKLGEGCAFEQGLRGAVEERAENAVVGVLARPEAWPAERLEGWVRRSMVAPSATTMRMGPGARVPGRWTGRVTVRVAPW
jgi:hypothetical protein